MFLRFDLWRLSVRNGEGFALFILGGSLRSSGRLERFVNRWDEFSGIKGV